MKYSVTILAPEYDRLVGIVFSKPDVEGAAYLLCGRSQTEQENRLLVREVIPVQEAHYEKRAPLSLSIKSESYVPVAKQAKEGKLSVLFVHSHPKGITEFSDQDDTEEPRLMAFFNQRAPDGSHGAVVMSSPNEIVGRVTIAGAVTPIDRFRIVGTRFRFIDRVRDDDTPPPQFFDRQVRAFGEEIQKLLARLHVGVVGAGGTGSAVFEQLVRLGIGRISVFDHDQFDESNVNRVYGSALCDAGKLKVDIAKAHANQIGLPVEVLKFPKGINDEDEAKSLRNCDIIFSCTDKQIPRSILTQVALRYFIPIFDVGVSIESTEGLIRGIYGRVTTFFPGEACLLCRGRISPEEIRLEGLGPSQREALVREGYAPELETNAPAVIMFTTAVASQAIIEFLHRITGFMGQARHSTEVLFRFHETAVTRNRQSRNEQCLCAQKRIFGKGDSRTFLDLSWPKSTAQSSTQLIRLFLTQK